jgi:hypothetical protein
MIPSRGAPGMCPKCGKPFQSSMIQLAPNAKNARISNVIVPCDNCGTLVNLADGAFSDTPEGLRVESGPEATFEIVAQLKRLAQRAEEEKLSAGEIIAAVAGIDPALGKKISRLSLPTAGLIFILFWLVSHVDIKIDVNQLFDQAVQAWHSQPEVVAPSAEKAFRPAEGPIGPPEKMALAPPPLMPSRRAVRRARGRAKRR